MRRRFLLVLSALILSGCGGGPPSVSGLDAELSGTSWTVERIVSPAPGGVVRGDNDRITFNADRTVTVTSCNTCNGSFEMVDGQLVIGPLACTRRGCPADDLELEQYLTAPLTIRRDGAYLVLDTVVESEEGTQILLVPADTR